MQDKNAIKEPDHTSDPNFLAYYTEKSASEAARAHFVRLREKMSPILASQFPNTEKFKVLDVGCNAGTQARVWAEHGHEVFGLDVNEPLLQVARARTLADGLKIQFDLGTAVRLPYADSSMDACLMLEFLEHVAEWEACLSEAVRVVKPGGLLYLSTTNALCPSQQEFNLPLYSWYPGFMKRRFERLAVTTRPELANHARYPACNWFTYYGLRRHLAGMSMRCLDRFDLIEGQGMRAAPRAALWVLRHLPPARLLGHVFTPGTSVLAIKNR